MFPRWPLLVVIVAGLVYVFASTMVAQLAWIDTSIERILSRLEHPLHGALILSLRCTR